MRFPLTLSRVWPMWFICREWRVRPFWFVWGSWWIVSFGIVGQGRSSWFLTLTMSCSLCSVATARMLTTLFHRRFPWQPHSANFPPPAASSSVKTVDSTSVNPSSFSPVLASTAVGETSPSTFASVAVGVVIVGTIGSSSRIGLCAGWLS